MIHYQNWKRQQQFDDLGSQMAELIGLMTTHGAPPPEIKSQGDMQTKGDQDASRRDYGMGYGAKDEEWRIR